MNNLDIFEIFAVGFGVGYLPCAPGTAGALLGAGLALGLHRLHRKFLFLTIVPLVFGAIAICERAPENAVINDDSIIVADEILTFPVATLTLPIRHHPLVLAGVFLTSRLVDILKPPPINALEQIPGGFGIVLDDVAANLLTLLAWSGLCRWKSIE